MAGKLSKEQRKALIQKVEEERAKHPAKNNGQSGFAAIDHEAEKLASQH